MRAYDQGAFFRVTVSESEVYEFARRWPCLGQHRALSFTFDKRNGDLVDLYGDSPDADGAGIVALSEDAQAYGRERLAALARLETTEKGS